MFRGAGIQKRKADQRNGVTAQAGGWPALLRAEGTAVGLVQLVLKGRLRGYGVGLVQLFRDWPCPEFPCPDVFARHLLARVLEDFRETGHHYLMHLVAERDHARRRGRPEEVSALDQQIHEHAIHEQIPERWRLDFLFSEAGYRTFGDSLLAFWATALIQLCTLEQHWEGALLGLRPENPYLLPGFHADKDVFDAAWLEDARRNCSEKVHPVAEPDEGEEELNDVHLEAEPNAATVAPWVN